MKKHFLFVVFFLLIIFNPVFSATATIHGEIFEWYSFRKLDNVIVEIDTTPIQRSISTNGEYSFEVGFGEYTISAKYYQNEELVYSDEQEIIISDEGTFRFDLMMFPVFDDLSEELEAIDFDEIELIDVDEREFSVEEERGEIHKEYFIGGLILVVLIVVLILFFIFSKRKTDSVKNTAKEIHIETGKEENLDEYAKRVLELLKRRGNRLTQKEIRDEMKDIGEAKVSLIIAELESMGKVKKIKKGRGNIIILKQK